MAWYEWPPYVPVGVRRQQAALEVARLRATGRSIAPVVIEGRTIARSFWGKAWCDNLESYARLVNRLHRGRSYVRNGSVMDLQLGAGVIDALVSGSALYRVSVTIAPLPPRRWQALVRECAGRIGSLVELLQGRFSRAVMETLIRRESGLFPSAREIAFDCSCPDRAALCKHVAATLYGIGARLDAEPELFFRLRRVDQLDLLTAASRARLPVTGPGSRKRIPQAALAEVFGIELDELAQGDGPPPRATPRPRRPAAGPSRAYRDGPPTATAPPPARRVPRRETPRARRRS